MLKIELMKNKSYYFCYEYKIDKFKIVVFLTIIYPLDIK